ncbi:MAG: HNH endonuclease [Lewinellaceae bacterium]|nr:HNH endonuclease [Lewinellaceae bacterium]
MPRKISADIRRQVLARANYRCEYCLIWQDDYYDYFQIDHIRSIKHGGLTELGNLAFSCSECNLHKGSDLGTFLGSDTHFTRFFNPRTDLWQDHFEAFEGALYPKTAIAEATIKIFQLNDPDRVIIRQELVMDGRWP